LNKLQDYLVGQWGLVVINKKKPDEICVATNGSPILIGFAPNGIYVASETIAFEKYTKDYVETKNGEIYTLCLETASELKKSLEQKGRLLKITH
jgi:glucosamine--fructose-6-phosphate aminotransferase (isomerizing)